MSATYRAARTSSCRFRTLRCDSVNVCTSPCVYHAIVELKTPQRAKSPATGKMKLSKKTERNTVANSFSLSWTNRRRYKMSSRAVCIRCISDAEKRDWRNAVFGSLALRSLVDAEKPRRRSNFGAKSRNSSSVELQHGHRGSGVWQIRDSFLPEKANDEMRLFIVSGESSRQS